MKTSITTASFSVGILVALITLFSVPVTADAQYRDRTMRDWSEYRNSRDSRAYRDEIDELDDDPVEDLEIPILFGITQRMLTKNFGDDRDGGDRQHEGLDILAPEGAPIVSPTEAVVVETGTGSASGKYVTTANPGGEVFVYIHLSEILVDEGDQLDRGDIIGYVGNTGNASGGPAHLHFEVRDGRDPMDPYPRLTEVFSLEEKIEFLERALNDVPDEEELVEFVVKYYATELRQAKAAGFELPLDVEQELARVPVYVPPTSSGSSGLAPGDLTINSQGAAVVSLQQFLINKNTGPAARALARASATGYFGPITRSALAEYQAANGITPPAGYYGPKTRAYIAAHE
jgi:hypothetical protein